ncbi:MAG: hypothetical protein ACEY3I_02845 [Arsenophonus sp.]
MRIHNCEARSLWEGSRNTITCLIRVPYGDIRVPYGDIYLPKRLFKGRWKTIRFSKN